MKFDNYSEAIQFSRYHTKEKLKAARWEIVLAFIEVSVIAVVLYSLVRIFL